MVFCRSYLLITDYMIVSIPPVSAQRLQRAACQEVDLFNDDAQSPESRAVKRNLNLGEQLNHAF